MILKRYRIGIMKPKPLSVKACIQSCQGGSKKATKAVTGNQGGNQMATLFFNNKTK